MRSSIWTFPGLPTSSAKASKVIWVGLPSRISTIVPPGSNGFLIAAASRFAMPSNMAVIGASTACSSGVAAESGLMRKPSDPAKTKTRDERLKILMAPDCNSAVNKSTQLQGFRNPADTLRIRTYYVQPFSRDLGSPGLEEEVSMARLLSVNVGLPRDVVSNNKTVRTAVWKFPVKERRMARKLNIDGDAQADLAGHGGEQRAVFVYQMDSYRYWERFLGRND